MSGPSPKPTRLKILQGNPGKRPLNQNEPLPDNKMPKIPGDLDKDAKKYWKRLGPILNDLGLLTEADGEIFGVMCQIRSRIKKIHGVLKEASYIQEKHTVDGAGQEHTELKKNPYVMMEQEYYKLFRAYASEFGLTPSSRSKLSVGNAPEDEFDKFMSRK